MTTTGKKILGIGILSILTLRLAVSLGLLIDANGFYTLSADDVARARLALLWARSPSFFPDLTWPPLPFWLGGLLELLFHTGRSNLCLLSILSSLFAIAIIAGLTHSFHDENPSEKEISAYIPAWFACAAYALTPAWVWLGTCALAEAIYIALFLAALLAYRYAWTRLSFGWAAVALLAAVFASMTRLEGAALAFILYILLSIRFRRTILTPKGAAFLVGGIVLLCLFPAAWMVSHSSGAGGNLSYFTRLKGGFTAIYGNAPWHTTLQFIRIYLEFSPLYLFLALVGFFVLQSSREEPFLRRPAFIYIAPILLYAAAQCAAAALGMMPTHSFWRLTAPVYVALLPLAGYSFLPLSRLMPMRYLLITVLFCVFHQAYKIPEAPIFVKEDLFQAGINLRDAAKERNVPPESLLIEVFDWEWMPIAFLGCGGDFTRSQFDRNQNISIALRMNDSQNPSLFAKSLPEIQRMLDAKKVQIAVAHSDRARKALMTLGWKAVKPGRYIVFSRP
ncbi:MAG: hypothetical protein AB1656_09140 [Candidatus Omnitrophota bacterium]